MTPAELETLISIAAEAASIIQRIYREPFTVEYKGPDDPITEADRRANEVICSRLEKEFAGVPIVAEESDPGDYAGFRSSSRILFVDPLDGTREFVRRNGEFVVMIGMTEEDRPTAGVLHAPARQMAWAGLVGDGAFCMPPDGGRRPIHVSAVDQLAAATVICARTRSVQRTLRQLGSKKLVAMGSAGLKAASVSTGDTDAYVAHRFLGKRWDLCAAEALIVASGGMVSDTMGKPIDYRCRTWPSGGGLVASNGKVHQEVLGRLGQLGLNVNDQGD